ncbi:MAG: MBL fold metallo-hydrolase [Candidatus Rokubacteria bacterium]|nr:MBL fold metallo-hydrolase [Candidatus Rokubacteria bacterium]
MRVPIPLLLLIAVALLVLPVPSPAADVEMTFYGNQHFKFVTPGGKVILINPWVKGNPDWPKDMKLEDIKKVDAIFVSGGHGDDMGTADEIAKQSGATIVTPFELGGYFQQVGVPAAQIFGVSAGGQGTIAGVRYQVVQTFHATGYTLPNNPLRQYGGINAGYILTFENGVRVYFASSSPLTMEFQLFGSRYKPHVALLPIGGRFLMHPDDAAYAAKLLMTENPNLKTLVPQHHRLNTPSPGGPGANPEAFEAEVKKLGLPLRVLNPRIGQTYRISETGEVK